MAWHLGQKAGSDFNIVSVKGGADVMNGLRGDDVDIGWVAGAQSKPVQQGEMVNIARGIKTPLADSPNAPSIIELGSEFYLDGYFMFIGPEDMDTTARDALGAAIRDVLEDGSTEANALVTKAFGGPAVMTGEDLDAYMQQSKADAEALLTSVSQ